MANIVYGWNPFQERVDCRVTNETIKTSGNLNRVEFVPRAAPFFAHNFKLYRQGSNQPLLPGQDFIFGHPFQRFIKTYQKNVYSSVILLKPVEVVLMGEYDTIGGPFVLDDVAYATLVANIINSPREALWENLVNVPTEFPSDPHEQPAAQVYDFAQMMDYLRDLILAVTQTTSDSPTTLKTLLEQHLAADLVQAHRADKGMLGLDNVENLGKATVNDITGNSDNLVVTVAVMKEALRRLAAGTLNLN
ncbi:hypothetical protein [Pseudomonas aeruginosa]|uniref:hypothetical protein n=1 Tax=Pseudomonas aeruginosa TaxID=287 RepID=UPI00244CF785|nr:hypothetical protein [Pseudomonas aeruginosa]MDH1421296.1 hypothetical protein [Pseudomonas aeruginosa]